MEVLRCTARRALLLAALVAPCAARPGHGRRRHGPDRHHAAAASGAAVIGGDGFGGGAEAGGAAPLARQDFEGELKALREANKKLVYRYKDVVGKYNKLVSVYNNASSQCEEVARSYGELETRLQDPSLSGFLATKAIEVVHHPGIRGAANKTAVYILPAALAGQAAAGEWFNRTYSSLAESLGDGELTGFLVYGMAFVPLFLSVWCALNFVCDAGALQLYGHLYFCLLSACASVFVLYMGEDPLSFFAAQNSELFLFAQSALGIVLAAHLLVVCVSVLQRSKWIDQMFGLLSHGSIVVAYYFLVWTPAMLDQAPRIEALMSPSRSWIVYLLPCAAFGYSYYQEEVYQQGGDTEEVAEKDDKGE